MYNVITAEQRRAEPDKHRHELHPTFEGSFKVPTGDVFRSFKVPPGDLFSSVKVKILNLAVMNQNFEMQNKS